MWMLPYFPVVSRVASHAYYRLTISGEEVPRTGPVLVVANHLNGLLDPVLVVEAAERNIRFLAKATLFTDPVIGWLVRSSGSIPVHRREDDPDLMDYNQETFRCVREELAGGSAVGVFPEGTSHSQPRLAAVKTGAARLALGSAAEIGRTFPLVPVGLVPACKTSFRSEMLVVIGTPIEWGDLEGRSDEDWEAVRELTSRIDVALRQVTLNIDGWLDQPIVEAAEAMWSAHSSSQQAPWARIARMRTTAQALADVQRDPDSSDSLLPDELRPHVRRLDGLRLEARDLVEEPESYAKWVLRCVRLALAGFLALIPFLLTRTLFFVPWWGTRWLAGAFTVGEDRIATYKILAGILMYSAWTLAIAVVLGTLVHWSLGLVTLVLLLPLGAWGNRVQEQWRIDALATLRRGRVRSMRGGLDDLRAEQAHLGERLAAVMEPLQASATVQPAE